MSPSTHPWTHFLSFDFIPVTLSVFFFALTIENMRKFIIMNIYKGLLICGSHARH
jgi:hypothetical protein